VNTIRRAIRYVLRDNVPLSFIGLYYGAFLVWSLYGGVFAYPISLIGDLVGRLGYDMWVWAPFPCVAVFVTGEILRKGNMDAADMSTSVKRQDYLGLWMKWGAHWAMSIILWVYVVTGFMGSTWGQPVVSVVLLSAYALGTFVLGAQCLYKWVEGRRLEGAL
jgi:hypothetical protein